MSKHLNWPEDDRICKLPDTIDDSPCPGCCYSVNPREYVRRRWPCIWKSGHTGNHADIWCFEWDDTGKIHKRPRHEGRCGYCGDPVDYYYCGMACSALDRLADEHD